jgi:LacI family transcriptional regulator, repressor for deo operon, udp, cdd, tsx, nupC, and nupG
VRLADVASRAQVSEATVSRVLNDKPGVSPANRRAILFALEELGYQRQPRFSGRRSGLVGLIVPELDNPVFPTFAQNIETALARGGYTPVLCTITPGGVREDEYVRLLLDRKVSGIVFVAGDHANSETGTARYEDLRAAGLPIVLVNGYRPGIDAPFLSVDDAAGVAQAVTHLARLGHVRIGLASGPERYTQVRRRVAAFETALRHEVGLDRLRAAGCEEPGQLVEHSVFSLAGGAAAATALLERGATAVICGSDVMALGAVQAARERGCAVPGDVSVVGCDGILYGEFFDPPLTTIRAPMEEIAEAAARALLDEIAGSAMPRAEYMFRPELIVRGSTAPPASHPDSAQGRKKLVRK